MTLMVRDQAREVLLSLPEHEDRDFVVLVVVLAVVGVVDIVVLGLVHFYSLLFSFFFMYFLSSSLQHSSCRVRYSVAIRGTSGSLALLCSS